ncbi:MAG TPA: VWA domain-containing protein [Leptospiraceae bacterium]|nr:VWA domain-containing protein [Leptospiraceae bacterium]HRG75282.1 VWA domain-containing protein [Leptospiraceae bacterium]
MANKIEISKDLGDNFTYALNQILRNDTMRQLCAEDAGVAETITKEILDFINQTKRQLIKTESPFHEELKHLEDFSTISEKNFSKPWESISNFLKSIYKDNQLDIDFYSKEFSKSLSKKVETKEKKSFESVKEHFQEKWNELLFKKHTEYELNLIDSLRKIFCDDLYKRIEEVKKLKEVLEPFTKELGRLWDMSKGSWQRVNFDLLKRYAALLEKDKALLELAEMLGRMRKAQEELEEEIFTNTILKPEWKMEHAHKSELVGIHESDDLGSMIPSEIALLSSPELETVFFKKYTEKKLQTFEYQSRSKTFTEEEIQDKRLKAKPLDKGPIIICVDTSGSMHGTPEQVAKTLCFALLKIAIQENRKCYLISFSTGIQTLNLTDLKNSLSLILDFLSMSFHGGTDATPALEEALRMLNTNDYKEADVLMISDFVMSNLPNSMKQKIIDARKNKTKFHSLVVGNSHNPSVMNEFDNNWIYDPTQPGSMIRLLKNLRESKI